MAETAWWRTAVIYEIVIPSFLDTNGDGWGDLAGITKRLDYLKNLGVGAIWLTPIHPSPHYDIGYDVSDYFNIHPRFGTLDDFDALLTAAHDRQLRVLIDFVPNHTSIDHPWFQQARRSRDDTKRQWYLWSDPNSSGGPPNNWINRFGNSAWTFDESTGQYYFSSFTAQQPDLNWRNSEVRQAMYDVLRFWFRRGVDGIRIDALAHLIKDERLRNNPRNLSYDESQEPYNRLSHVFQQNQPELLDVITELRSVMDEFDDRMMIGEVYQTAEQITAYQRAGAHLLLNTSMLQTDFETVHLRNMIDIFEGRTAVGAWPSRCSGNHDLPRLASRVGEANLRLAALLHFTVRSAPTMYYGEELGLEEMDVAAEKMQDPSGREDPRYGCDGRRAPMPWDESPGGGFSTAEP
jgi:alpha-glucosidase